MSEQVTSSVPASAPDNTDDEPARTIDVTDKSDPPNSTPLAFPKPPMGDLARLKDLALEERLRKRQERFGIVQPIKRPVVPLADDGAVTEDLRKRRERFGVVERDPRPVVPSADAKGAKENARKREELKRNRGLKFGESDANVTLSEEERQRRLKRLRRFQSTGNAAVV